MFDLLIKNGKILDGTGSPSFFSDIAVKNGKIVKISKNINRDEAEKVIDASSLTVTPGFIDSHSHSDTQIFDFPEQIEKIEQGITTFVGGQCGISSAPLSRLHEEKNVASFGKNTEIFKTMGTFLNTLQNVPLGSNMAIFVGHSALRNAVIGPDNRKPTQEELEEMAELLREGIKNGALGISFGLIYAPSCYAKTDEIIYLATVAAQCGGMISAHIRDEGYMFCRAVEEFIEVIKASNARGVFSHHKAMYKENWGKVNNTLRMIDDACNSGCDIYCDVYPYTASHTSLSARFIPKEYHSGGKMALCKNLSDPQIRKTIKEINNEKFAGDDLNWVLVTDSPLLPQYEGMHLPDIAKAMGKDLFDTVFDLIIENKGLCSCCFFLMCEEDLETVLAHPRSMVCTDAYVQGNNNVYHPRTRGSFPRALGRYVRQRKVVSMPEMIRKITSMPATVYGLSGKGLIKEGFDADICIFDENKIIDKSDYTSLHNRAEGLNFVILGGDVVVENAVFNGKCRGKVLQIK